MNEDGWFASALRWLNGLVTGTEGDGQSSTKLMYLVAGLGSAVAATIMTLTAAFVGAFAIVAPFLAAVIERPHPAVTFDGAFWPAYFTCLGGLWIALFGYATSAKKNAANATKEITIAKSAPLAPAPAPATTTTEVTASRTTTTPGTKKK